MAEFLAWLLRLLMSAAHPKPSVVNNIVNNKAPEDHGGLFGLPTWVGVAPAWGAVLVAIFVGYFSVKGIRGSLAGLQLQREAYAESVWQTKVSVARLVYADVLDTKEVKPGDTRPSFDPRPTVIFGHEYQDDEGVSHEGFATSSVTRQVNALHVLVRNSSKEPVGRARLSLHYPEVTDEPAPEDTYELDTLKPESEFHCVIYYPRDRPLYDQNPETGEVYGMVRAFLRLNFFDSAGVEWRREETYAPMIEQDGEVLKHVDDGFTGWT